MTYQEFFDKVWYSVPLSNHGWDDNKKLCCYRLSGEATDKRRCFIGRFIPDKIYEFSMETYRPPRLLVKFPKITRYFPKDEKQTLGAFLKAVQDAHDEAFLYMERASRQSNGTPLKSVKQLMYENLRLVARNYKLTVPKECDTVD